MDLQHIRYDLRQESMGSRLLWGPDGGEPFGFVVEEPYRDGPKIPGETCIPAGSRRLGLRTEGGMHADYSRRFSWHKGMLWILDVPDFEYVYYHIGNFVVGRNDDTLGCPLVNTSLVERADGELDGQGSTAAYKRLYEAVVPHILAGEEVWTHITNEGLFE